MNLRILFPATSILLALCSCTSVQTPPQIPQIPVTRVIYMIGDGMGVAQITQLILENDGEPVNMERAHYAGLVKTFSANNRVTDSAAGGTALATGSKVNNDVIGLDTACNPLSSVLHVAMEHGWNTAIVVTNFVTDATPAAFYSHAGSRKQYEDIALQLSGSGIDVVFGGGRNHFTDRQDGMDLLREMEGNGYLVLTTVDSLQYVEQGPVIGLFSQEEGLGYALQGRGDYLPKATEAALRVLEGTGDPFFLMIEGSLIDYAAHDHLTGIMLEETRDFDHAVGLAFDFADRNPGTLVIVTADHETGGLTIVSSNEMETHEDGGIEYRFSTGAHSASLVPVMAYGTGADLFTGIMDNTDIPAHISNVIRGSVR